MNAVNLVFEVHATTPQWIKNQQIISYENDFSNSRYRIFVNGNLIVERNWVFETNIFLRENLWLDHTLDIYTLKLEPVVCNVNQIKFSIKNPTVNNKVIDHSDDQLELSFKV